MSGQGLSAHLESHKAGFRCFLTAHMRVSSIQLRCILYIQTRMYTCVHSVCIYRHNCVEGCIPSKGGPEFNFFFYFYFLTACILRYVPAVDRGSGTQVKSQM